MAPDRDDFMRHFLAARNDLAAFLGSVIRDQAAREDCFQEVSMVLWREFDRFDTTRSFGAWARGIAVNIALKHRDRLQRGPHLCDPAVLQAMAEAWQRTEPESDGMVEALRQCMGTLGDRQRSLLAMRYDAGMSLEKMALELKRTTAAVNMALSRLREALQRCIVQRRRT